MIHSPGTAPDTSAAPTHQAMEDGGPGRSCPLHYRYRPSDLGGMADPAYRDLDVLYVVGGLYGNEWALHAVLELFDAETGRKALVFNGDFHWFDAEPALFERIQRAVLGHVALRGNVETELAQPPGASDAGCGCAYPDWVGDEVVARSNRILQRLRGVTTQAQRAALGALPMWLRADVGDLRLAIVHGDAQSLAGWGFAQENLRDPVHRAQVRAWLDEAQVQAFACSHTCLPVFQAVEHGVLARWVLNNGAAGMPNFRGDLCGLLTRIAVEPCRHTMPMRFGARWGAVHLDALAIAYDADAWQRSFVSLWPLGSDAHASYFGRIAQGPCYAPDEAVRRIA